MAVVAVGDPRAPYTWSGVTAGICAGLQECGVDALPIDLTLFNGLETLLRIAAATPTRNRYDAEGAALTRRVRSGVAVRRLRGASLSGVIQIGTTFELPAGERFVTLEDMSLRQAVGVHPVFSRMTARTVNSWERQRARIYSRAVMVATASRWTAQSLHDDYGLAPERIAVVGFGANHLVKQRERDWSRPRFLFVGLDWHRKGGPLLLHAFRRLRLTHPEAQLDLAGGHPPIDELGVNAHGVLERGSVEGQRRVSELFAQATCFVMPSAVEPFGIAHVEAASAGIPSIGTSVGGPPDVIGEDAGVVVQPGDADALLGAMVRLADADTARCMGAVAQERSRLYTWGKVAERLMRALDVGAPDGRSLAGYL